MDGLCCSHRQTFWPLPIPYLSCWYLDLWLPFPLRAAIVLGAAAFMGIISQNLLSSVPWPASRLQRLSLRSVSVFCSHTRLLGLIGTPVHAVSQIPNASILRANNHHRPPNSLVQFLTRQRPLLPPRGLQFADSCPVSQAIISLFVSLSLNPIQSSVISNTPLFFSRPLLFCCKGKTSFLHDPSDAHFSRLSVVSKSQNMAGRFHCKYVTTCLRQTPHAPVVLLCFFG